MAHPLDHDPDMTQALEDLRPVFAELRAAKATLRQASKSVLANQQAAQSHVNELRARIRLRAERLGVDFDGLLIVLREEHTIRTRQRRKPARRFMVGALVRAKNEAAQDLVAARADLERAQQHLAQSEKIDRASRAALEIYGDVA